MHSIFRAVLSFGEKIQLAIGVCSLVTIIVSISAGVIFRFLLDNPLTWPEELATLLFIWLAFMGASVAAARNQHIVVDVVTQRIPSGHRKRIEVLIDVLICLFTVLTSLGALKLLPRVVIHKSVALDIPRVYYYLPVLISSFYLFLLYSHRLLRAFAPRAASPGGVPHD